MPLLLVIVVLLALASPAQAQFVPAGERVQAQVRLAQDFWSARNVLTCPDGVVAQLAEPLISDDSSGRVQGTGSGCHVWLDRAYVREVRRARGPLGYRVALLADQWSLIVHEVGHALGLPHSADGIMAADPLAWPVPWPVPWR